MVYKLNGEQPFQVLSSDFSISPSESGYELYFSADGFNYTSFATVGAGVTRQFTGMNAGNYYKLMGNTGEVSVNWERDCCGGQGGSGAGVSSLNGQTGALTTKTINGNDILGSGDITIEGGDAGVSSLDGQTGALTTKTINGNSILGSGDITIEGYDLPTASSSTLGGVKIGNGLSIDANGVLSAKVVSLSQSDYDALVQAGTVDANTLYVII